MQLTNRTIFTRHPSKEWPRRYLPIEQSPRGTYHYTKSTIFRRLQLFLMKIKLFLTVYVGRRKLYPIFTGPFTAVENWAIRPPKVIGPLKIELLSMGFFHRVVEHNWAAGNRKFSLLPPVQPTHAPTLSLLLALVFMPPSTTAAALHRTPPLQPPSTASHPPLRPALPSAALAVAPSVAPSALSFATLAAGLLHRPPHLPPHPPPCRSSCRPLGSSTGRGCHAPPHLCPVRLGPWPALLVELR
jgi:hypothetical protein